MTEFTAGDAVPPIEFVDAAQSGGDLTVSQAELVPGAETISLAPLPSGVFGGDATSQFIVEARSKTTFEEVYDDPDGRTSCQPCVAGG